MVQRLLDDEVHKSMISGKIVYFNAQM